MLGTDRAAKYFGFVAKISFEDGMRTTIDWYRHSRGGGPSSLGW
jgi:nucleoside-diphosphate-sugar epimerase